MDIDSMSQISFKMFEFPQLKIFFLTQLLSNTDALSTNLSNILRESNLSSCCAIAKFVSASTLTALHIDGRVLAEWMLFTNMKTILINRYGQNTWTYYKLICPDDKTAATTDLPFLTAAAKAWSVETRVEIFHSQCSEKHGSQYNLQSPSSPPW